jgi:hypothetical protein
MTGRSDEAYDDARRAFCDDIAEALSDAVRAGVVDDDLRADFEAVLSIQDHPTDAPPRPVNPAASDELLPYPPGEASLRPGLVELAGRGRPQAL